ncbi:MAG: RIP metalloprotease RseP [Nitrospirae bacterium]|nr:RIP metalloprotease RseP [Nitrospirota bacterium]
MSSLLAISPDAVWVVLQKAWWFLIVLGVLIAFHEMGHFLAARWLNIKVLKFSLGFGPKLLGRQVGETEYLLSAVPLGGYVKLFGEEETEALTDEERRRSFSHQPVWKKVAVVAAGPGFNFVLAYLIFTGWLATGAPLPVPTIRDLTPDVEAVKPGSPAEQAGLRTGDRILRVNEKDISTRAELYELVSKGKGKQVALDVRRGDQVRTLLLTPTSSTIKEGEHDITTYHLGIEETPPVVTAVVNGSPAQAAGFRDGDRVIVINGQDIQTWSQMTALVRDNPNHPLAMMVSRDGQIVSLTVTPLPERMTIDGKTVEVGKIGISGPGRSVMKTSNPVMAVYDGVRATWGWTELTVVGIYKMIVGEISSKNIGGPLTIATMSGEAASQGAASILLLISMLSINLGVLNLLPIPILDGGHLLFFGIEAILRKPLGERQREIAQQVGLLLLVGIMVFAFWNDIERLISH